MATADLLICQRLELFPEYELHVALLEKKGPGPLPAIDKFLTVDASIIPDIFLIASATSRAISSSQHNSLKTKSLYEEIAFYLLPSNNVIYSLI